MTSNKRKANTPPDSRAVIMALVVWYWVGNWLVAFSCRLTDPAWIKEEPPWRYAAIASIVLLQIWITFGKSEDV